MLALGAGACPWPSLVLRPCSPLTLSPSSIRIRPFQSLVPHNRGQVPSELDAADRCTDALARPASEEAQEIERGWHDRVKVRQKTKSALGFGAAAAAASSLVRPPTSLSHSSSILLGTGVMSASAL